MDFQRNTGFVLVIENCFQTEWTINNAVCIVKVMFKQLQLKIAIKITHCTFFCYYCRNHNRDLQDTAIQVSTNSFSGCVGWRRWQWLRKMSDWLRHQQQTGAVRSLSKQHSAVAKCGELNWRVTIKMSALLVDWEGPKGFILLWPFYYGHEKDWKCKRVAFLESQRRADLVAWPDPDCQKILQED